MEDFGKDFVVYLLDDDANLRSRLTDLVEATGVRAKAVNSAPQFVRLFEPQHPGCLVLDIELSGTDGLAFQEELNRRQITLPVIFYTAVGNVRSAVQALHNGAVDFISKASEPARLLSAIHRVVRTGGEGRGRGPARHPYYLARWQSEEAMPGQRLVDDFDHGDFGEWDRVAEDRRISASMPGSRW